VIPAHLSRLARAAARHKSGLAWGIACVAASNVVQLSQPLVLQHAIDDLYAGVTAEKLGRYALIVLGIAVLAGLFRFGMRHWVIGISRQLEFDFRNELFAHLQKQPVEWFHRRRTGELMSIATNDMAAVRMMLGPGVMYTVNTLSVGLLSLTFMLAISPRLTLLSLLPLPLVTLSVWWFGDRIHRRFEQVQQRMAVLSAQVQENLAGVRVVRAFGAEPHEAERFDRLSEDYRKGHVDLIRVSGVFQPSLAFWSGVGALLAIWIGGREVILGHITLGQFVAFTVYLAMLNWPTIALGWVINIFQRGSASFRRIVDLLDEDPAIATRPSARRPAGPAHGAIEFRNLTFRYPGAPEPVLHDVSFQAPPGSTVAIVGRTASGKSTVLALLSRLFDPPPGTVFVDGHDVLELDLAWLRGQVASVPQDPFLFSITVAANIAFGVEQADQAAVMRAAKIAHLHADVADFPQGYATLVGERGITLSGGQKQRTAIARAVLRDAPILLLDDCLSNVDTQTEEAILEGLRGEMRRRTTLLVSHRVSTVRDADLILVLDHGRIVERGHHAELLELSGHYAALHRAQQLEDEIAAS
jgi:ATP-binding cassette subfamily B protein